MSYHKNTPHYTDPDTGVSYPAIIDMVTGAAVSIDFAHHELHEGDHYAYQETVDQALSNVYDLRLQTPNTAKWGHMEVMFDTEAATESYLYENVTRSTTGTRVTPLNRNRNSTNSAAIILTYVSSTATSSANAATGLTSASVLAHGLYGALGKGGGGGDTRMEWILKQNTTYAIRFIASAAGFVNFLVDWYEHTNEY